MLYLLPQLQQRNGLKVRSYAAKRLIPLMDTH